MRNVATVFILIFSLCMLAGCGAVNKTGEESNFNATVLEISGNTVTVEPVDGEDILRSADRITFANDSLVCYGYIRPRNQMSGLSCAG